MPSESLLSVRSLDDPSSQWDDDSDCENQVLSSNQRKQARSEAGFLEFEEQLLRDRLNRREERKERQQQRDSKQQIQCKRVSRREEQVQSKRESRREDDLDTERRDSWMIYPPSPTRRRRDDSSLPKIVDSLPQLERNCQSQEINFDQSKSTRSNSVDLRDKYTVGDGGRGWRSMVQKNWTRPSDINPMIGNTIQSNVIVRNQRESNRTQLNQSNQTQLNQSNQTQSNQTQSNQSNLNKIIAQKLRANLSKPKLTQSIQHSSLNLIQDQSTNPSPGHGNKVILSELDEYGRPWHLLKRLESNPQASTRDDHHLYAEEKLNILHRHLDKPISTPYLNKVVALNVSDKWIEDDHLDHSYGYIDRKEPSKSDWKKRSIQSFQRDQVTRKQCHYCLENGRISDYLLLHVDPLVTLILLERGGLVPMHCLIVPNDHVSSCTLMEDAVWENVEKLMQNLVLAFQRDHKVPIFLETVYEFNRRHTIIECIPIDEKLAEIAPTYFQKAIMECESEWHVHQKCYPFSATKSSQLKNNQSLSDEQTRQAMNKITIRETIPAHFPYFMVQFGVKFGFAHQIESKQFSPRFGREIVATILQLPLEDYIFKPRPKHRDQCTREAAKFFTIWQK